MKIIKNDKLIRRNARLAQVFTLASLGIFGVSMYISSQAPELLNYALGAVLVGFALAQVGMYLTNRFGRSPRPDESLDAGLKGLPGDFSIYHYSSPVAHLLVGPSGAWVLMPYHQRGTVFYNRNRWRMSGGGFFQWYMRILGQESLGRPELEADGEIRSLQRKLSKRMEESEIPEIRAALIFTNPDVQVDAGDAPIPALKIKQLKDFMRQQAKARPVTALTLETVKSALEA